MLSVEKKGGVFGGKKNCRVLWHLCLRSPSILNNPSLDFDLKSLVKEWDGCTSLESKVNNDKKKNNLSGSTKRLVCFFFFSSVRKKRGFFIR